MLLRQAGRLAAQTESPPASQAARQGAHHNDIRWDLVPGEEGDDLAGFWQATFLQSGAGRGRQRQQRQRSKSVGQWALGKVPLPGLAIWHNTSLPSWPAPAGPE